MSADQWAAASAVGQLIAAAISFFALIFVGLQIRAASRSTDLQTLQEFFQMVTERERALLDATNELDRNQAFVEFINLLEIYSAAYNKKILAPVSREQVGDKLIDSIVLITKEKTWHRKLYDGMTSSVALKELLDFKAQHKAEIDRIVRKRPA